MYLEVGTERFGSSGSSLLFYGVLGVFSDAEDMHVTPRWPFQNVSPWWKLARHQVSCCCWQISTTKKKVFKVQLQRNHFLHKPEIRVLFPWYIRSMILVWVLVALGHSFILEQPCGSFFRSFPQWRYFCKYICRATWWKKTYGRNIAKHFFCAEKNLLLGDSVSPAGISTAPLHATLGVWLLQTHKHVVQHWCGVAP